MTHSNLANNYQRINNQIAKYLEESKRPANSVELLAVSKGQPVDKIMALYELGHRDFGENYVQELVTKAEALAHLTDISWHYIGHIQSNKIAAIAKHCTTVHTISSTNHARKLNAACTKLGNKIAVFIEVNAAGEPNKSGCTWDELNEIKDQISQCHNLHISGIMAIPPRKYQDTDPLPTSAPEIYLQLAAQAQALGGGLSLGMSGDLGLAIKAGSTIVRIGTSLFGARSI